jgi:hypothetical protein
MAAFWTSLAGLFLWIAMSGWSAAAEPNESPVVAPLPEDVTSVQSLLDASQSGPVTVVGYLRRVALPCPPCPEGVKCEPCKEPHFELRDLPDYLTVFSQEYALRLVFQRIPRDLDWQGRVLLVGQLEKVTGGAYLRVSEFWPLSEVASASNHLNCDTDQACTSVGSLCWRRGQPRCIRPKPLMEEPIRGVCVAECQPECAVDSDCSLGGLPSCCGDCCGCPSVSATSIVRVTEARAFCAVVDCVVETCEECPPCPKETWPEDVRAACVLGECVVRH